MAFNARLEIAYSYTDVPPSEIFISTAFIDYTNLYTPDLITAGFKIFQDVTGWGFAQDILVYEVIENQGTTDEGASYNLRARWTLPGDLIELQTGYTTIIGEPDSYGGIDVPEPFVQNMDLVSTNRLRNYIMRAAKPNIITNDTFSGEVNGSNSTIVATSNFKTQTVKVYRNGMRMKMGVDADYVLEGNTTINFNFIPEATDVIIVDYEKV